MHTFVAIGGGEISARETESIDRYALQLTGAEQPEVLFMPTASGDDAGYSRTFTDYYGSLGANVSVLELTKNPSSNEVEDAILSTDMIYCGGGNTEFAIETWKQHGVPELLEQSKQRQRMQVLGGISAGANIWFEFYMPEVNLSTSETLGAPETDDPVKIGHGLGLIDNTVVSVHHSINDPIRNEALDKILPLPNRRGKTSSNAYAIGDHAAVIIEPDARIGAYAITSHENANAHIVSPRLGMPHRLSWFPTVSK